jgi:hypothetical protein
MDFYKSELSMRGSELLFGRSSDEMLAGASVVLTELFRGSLRPSR